MHASTILLAFGAAAVMAAPSYPNLDTDASMPNTRDLVHDYFNLLSKTVQDVKSKGVQRACDLTLAKLPETPKLPPHADGLKLKHVLIGRGTQNYTCDVNNATAPPVATGAIATLFDASCLAASQHALLDSATKVALAFNLPPGSGVSGPITTIPLAAANIPVAGFHYFNGAGAPVFDLNTAAHQYGMITVAKNASEKAPTDAQKGPNGEAAVPWLRLLSKGQTTNGLAEVYRVATAGGSAPAKCQGQQASFEHQYSTQYWIYGSE